MIVSDHVGGPGRVLHRMAPASGSEPVGEWTITLTGGTTAHYTFAADGSMRVRAQVGDERDDIPCAEIPFTFRTNRPSSYRQPPGSPCPTVYLH